MNNGILTDHEANVFQEAFSLGFLNQPANGILSDQDANIFHEGFNLGLAAHRENLVTHYVNKNNVMDAAMTGNQVIALCGAKWKSYSDLQKFTVCENCRKIYETVTN